MAPNRLSDPDFLGRPLTSRSFLEALAGSSSSEPEIQALAVPFQFFLVGFFPSKRSSLDSIRRFFSNLKLNGQVSVTLLDQSHILIKLSNDLDYCRVFCHRSYIVFNSYMKLTKWTPLTDVGIELPVIPIWVSFPQLRPHLYSPRILHGLATIFGKPLKIDSATSVGSRPSMARVLVELDITESYPNKVWIGPENLGYVQQVVMEDFPPFFASCKCIGHVVGNCRPLSSADPIHANVKPGLNHSSPPVIGGENASIASVVPFVSGDKLDPKLDDSSVCAVEPVSLDLRLNVGEAGELNCDTNLKSINSGVDVVVVPGEVSLPHATLGEIALDHVDASVVDASLSCEGGVAVAGDLVIDVASGDDFAGCSPVLFTADPPILSPITNVLEGRAEIVDIPISVMSNAYLKAQVVRSLHNSVLVQTDWLNMEESPSSPSVKEGDAFGAHINDDIYNYMVGCVVDQPVLNHGGKRLKSKSKKK
ncbi:hypothetical protein M5K25_006379 [Dendrobium thyrsiflorum]|uniref:DUF4283 domain-containing protein n=1 Tax=Dendrobium thyrsiflorum TaxID=117978 RepID=A0ABD0VCN4_DENTH